MGLNVTAAGFPIFNWMGVGWNPDLNDRVRLNIRPFMLVGDVESAPWFNLGPEYDEKLGSRINDHYLTLARNKRLKMLLRQLNDDNIDFAR